MLCEQSASDGIVLDGQASQLGAAKDSFVCMPAPQALAHLQPCTPCSWQPLWCSLLTLLKVATEYLPCCFEASLTSASLQVSQLAAPGVQLPEEQAGPRDAADAAEQAVGVQEGLGMPFAESGNPVMALVSWMLSGGLL